MSDCTNCEGQPDVLGAQTKPVAKNSLKRWLKKLLICLYSWAGILRPWNQWSWEARGVSIVHLLSVFSDVDDLEGWFLHLCNFMGTGDTRRRKNGTFAGNLAGKGIWKREMEKCLQGIFKWSALECVLWTFSSFVSIKYFVKSTFLSNIFLWSGFIILCVVGRRCWGAQREGPGDRWNPSYIYTRSPNLSCQGYFFKHRGEGGEDWMGFE